MPSTSTIADGRFENFTITSIIVHFLSRDSISGSVTTNYSETEINLSAEGIEALRTRVISAISIKSKTLEMEFTNNTSSIFKLITQCFNEAQSSDDFTTISKEIAKSLHKVIEADRRVPDGAIFIIKGNIIYNDNKKRCAVIIKAETQNGFTVDLQNQRDIVQFIKNLFLTPAQKMYKVAFIIDKTGSVGDNNVLKSPSEYDISDCEVYIFDTNSTSSTTSAKYFYNTFMGCDFEKNLAIKTREFYQNTIDFINIKYEEDAEMRIDLISAVKTYLKMDTDQFISTETFSTRYLQNDADRQEYLQYMQSKDVSSTAFSRDISLISSKLKNRILYFENGIKITGSQSNFSENVHVMNRKLGEILTPTEEINSDNMPNLLTTLDLNNSTIVKISGFPDKEQ